MSLTAAYLILGKSTATSCYGGCRWQNVTIPKGSTITNAVVTLVTAAAHEETGCNVLIRGQAIANPVTFTTVLADFTARAKTTASVAWTNIETWPEADSSHQTPELKTIIQEIINRTDWVSGNAMVLFFEDNVSDNSGRRDFRAWDSSVGQELLHIEYTLPSGLVVRDLITCHFIPGLR